MTLPEFKPEQASADRSMVTAFLRDLGPLDVETEEDAEAVARKAREAKRIREQITETRMSYTRPLDAEKTKWTTAYGPLVDGLTLIEKQGAGNITLFRKIVREEQERLRATLENDAQRAAEDGRLDDAAAALTELDNVPVKGYVPAGTGKTGRWKGDCEDLFALITWVSQDIPRRHRYLAPDAKEVGDYAREVRGPSQIPGIRVWFEEGTSIGRAGL